MTSTLFLASRAAFLASMMELRCFVVTSAASGLVPSSTDNGSCKTSGVMFFSALASVKMVSICLRRRRDEMAGKLLLVIVEAFVAKLSMYLPFLGPQQNEVPCPELINRLCGPIVSSGGRRQRLMFFFGHDCFCFAGFSGAGLDEPAVRLGAAVR